MCTITSHHMTNTNSSVYQLCRLVRVGNGILPSSDLSPFFIFCPKIQNWFWPIHLIVKYYNTISRFSKNKFSFKAQIPHKKKITFQFKLFNQAESGQKFKEQIQLHIERRRSEVEIEPVGESSIGCGRRREVWIWIGRLICPRVKSSTTEGCGWRRTNEERRRNEGVKGSRQSAAAVDLRFWIRFSKGESSIDQGGTKEWRGVRAADVDETMSGSELGLD